MILRTFLLARALRRIFPGTIDHITKRSFAEGWKAGYRAYVDAADPDYRNHCDAIPTPPNITNGYGS